MSIIQQISRVSSNIETSTRASEFVACAKSLLAARGNASDAARFAESNGFSDRVIRFVKGAVTAGSTAGVGWAEELVQYRQVADAFLSSLAPYSSFDKILNANRFVRLPMETRIVVTSTAATGTTAAEAEQKPVTQLQFSASNLVARKAVAIVVVSDEIALSANQAAFNLIGTELRKAVGIASDSTFLSVVSETTGVASSSSSGTTLTHSLLTSMPRWLRLRLAARRKFT